MNQRRKESSYLTIPQPFAKHLQLRVSSLQALLFSSYVLSGLHSRFSESRKQHYSRKTTESGLNLSFWLRFPIYRKVRWKSYINLVSSETIPGWFRFIKTYSSHGCMWDWRFLLIASTKLLPMFCLETSFIHHISKDILQNLCSNRTG